MYHKSIFWLCNHCSVDEGVKKLVKNIETFPTRHSHYSRKDNQERVYLPSDLPIARLYHDFLEKHDPDYIVLDEENRKRVLAHEPIQKLRKPLISEHMYLLLTTIFTSVIHKLIPAVHVTI